jgi:hypothetical protein
MAHLVSNNEIRLGRIDLLDRVASKVRSSTESDGKQSRLARFEKKKV